MGFRGGPLSNFLLSRNLFIVRCEFTPRGNRFFAPLEAFGELLHKSLFNYIFSLVSKTVFGLSLRRLVQKLFNRVQNFRDKDPVYLRRDRAKNILYYGKEV